MGSNNSNVCFRFLQFSFNTYKFSKLTIILNVLDENLLVSNVIKKNISARDTFLIIHSKNITCFQLLLRNTRLMTHICVQSYR